jgi:hypothetical protein
MKIGLTCHSERPKGGEGLSKNERISFSELLVTPIPETRSFRQIIALRMTSNLHTHPGGRLDEILIPPPTH